MQLHNKDHAPNQVRPALEKVLKELQIQQLDLFLMHWPVTGNKGDTVEPSIKVAIFFVDSVLGCAHLTS